MFAPSVMEMIGAGESLMVEFKRDANDSELIEAVVCMANGGGGTILIGVDDSGVIHGARHRHGKLTDTRRLEALVSNNTRPSLGVQVELETLEGKPIVVIRVPQALIPTATASGKYLRRVIGGDTRPASYPFSFLSMERMD